MKKQEPPLKTKFDQDFKLFLQGYKGLSLSFVRSPNLNLV